MNSLFSLPPLFPFFPFFFIMGMRFYSHKCDKYIGDVYANWYFHEYRSKRISISSSERNIWSSEKDRSFFYYIFFYRCILAWKCDLVFVYLKMKWQSCVVEAECKTWNVFFLKLCYCDLSTRWRSVKLQLFGWSLAPWKILTLKVEGD